LRRRLARELAVQSLFFLDMNEQPIVPVVDYVIDEARFSEEDRLMTDHDTIENADFVTFLVSGTRTHLAMLDGVLAHYLQSWRIERLSKVDVQILRMALFEMLYAEDVPAAAAINEAVDLAKRFGTEESGKFVNGVLGKLVLDLDDLRSKWLTP
jgi:N utilization substance protein B